MPTCAYKHCHKVAKINLGSINTGEKDGYGKPWPVVVFVCEKHAKKVCKKLSLNYKEDK